MLRFVPATAIFVLSLLCFGLAEDETATCSASADEPSSSCGPSSSSSMALSSGQQHKSQGKEEAGDKEEGGLGANNKSNNNGEMNIPKGHLLPLGSHRPSDGNVKELAQIPDSQTFFEQYSQPGVPVIFRNAARSYPAFKDWTDEHLMSKYGDLIVHADVNGKDNRSNSGPILPLREFVQTYTTSGRYLIDSLPEEMKPDVYLFPSLYCGGFTAMLQDVAFWFNRGDGSSLFHFDTVDNIYCVISGRKDIIFVDKSYMGFIPIDHPEGDYCGVDVDAVDMFKYPQFRDLPWTFASVRAGDCVFIPVDSFHHVKSIDRSISVNLWWTPLSSFQRDHCHSLVPPTFLRQGAEPKWTKPEDVLPIGVEGIRYHPYEHLRYMLQRLARHLKAPLTLDDFKLRLFHEHSKEALMIPAHFPLLDKNGDGLVTMDELNLVTNAELHRAMPKFKPGEIYVKYVL